PVMVRNQQEVPSCHFGSSQWSMGASPRQALQRRTSSEVETHFARVTADQPVAYLPMKRDRKGGLISKGFGFFCSMGEAFMVDSIGGLKLVAVFES
ncbi:hypothetical protein Tco_1414850, partial [Tanacetum coccineum]